MAIEAHIAELSSRHRKLEERLAQEMSRPGADDLRITEIKREKLRLKEEIERLRQRVHQVH
jgi:hypothetical protein